MQFLTYFVDYYINFTLRQWTGRVERARIIFSHDDWGAAGAEHRAQGAAAAPATPLAPPMKCSGQIIVKSEEGAQVEAPRLNVGRASPWWRRVGKGFTVPLYRNFGGLFFKGVGFGAVWYVFWGNRSL